MFIRFLAAAAAFVALNANAGLNLQSDRALVFDWDTGKTLYAKSADAPAPIASVTKLMTAMVLLDEQPNLDEVLTITEEDVDTLKHSSSRLPVGTRLTRRELLHLALMSSENRAAHALARTSSLGRDKFVRAMNVKAKLLGMDEAHFADPTGLSPSNRASASDLGKLLEASTSYEAIKEYSTTKSERVSIGGSELNFRNTNPAVMNGWDVLVQKTGFIREAGRVVVVGFKTAGKNLGVVLMGADSSSARMQDLVRVRNWVSGVEPPRVHTKTASLKSKGLKRSSVRMSAAKVSTKKSAKATQRVGKGKPVVAKRTSVAKKRR